MTDKGISRRINKSSIRFEAYVLIKNKGGKSRNRFKAYIGTYDTIEQAELARLKFIDSLK